jgi:hypothetical protein
MNATRTGLAFLLTSVAAACSAGSPAAGPAVIGPAGDAAAPDPASDGGGACAVSTAGAAATGTITGDGPYGRLTSVAGVYGLLQNGPSGWWLWIVYTDYANACGYVRANEDEAGGSGISIYLQSTGADPGVDAAANLALQPGTYTITKGVADTGTSHFLLITRPTRPNGACGQEEAGNEVHQAYDGTFTLTSITPALSGSFDLAVTTPLDVSNTMHVRGTFSEVSDCTPPRSRPGVCCSSGS